MNKGLKDLMSDYFDSLNETCLPAMPIIGMEIMTESLVPVVPHINVWEIVTDPNRLMRSFEFNDDSALKYFVCELLDYQDDIGHHGKITIQHGKVIIEVYTHDVDDVTELDKEYASMADSIFDDVSHTAYRDYSIPMGDLDG